MLHKNFFKNVQKRTKTQKITKIAQKSAQKCSNLTVVW